MDSIPIQHINRLEPSNPPGGGELRGGVERDHGGRGGDGDEHRHRAPPPGQAGGLQRVGGVPRPRSRLQVSPPAPTMQPWPILLLYVCLAGSSWALLSRCRRCVSSRVALDDVIACCCGASAKLSTTPRRSACVNLTGMKNVPSFFLFFNDFDDVQMRFWVGVARQFPGVWRAPSFLPAPSVHGCLATYSHKPFPASRSAVAAGVARTKNCFVFPSLTVQGWENERWVPYIRTHLKLPRVLYLRSLAVEVSRGWVALSILKAGLVLSSRF